MEEDIISFDKNITFYFNKQKETRLFIKNLDDLYKKIHTIEDKEISKDSEYIKQRNPLDIIMKCYAIESDIAISQKHLLLSTQEQEYIYFAKLICMTIHTGIDFIKNIMTYLKSHSDTRDIELFTAKLGKIHKYKKMIDLIRDHSIAHIEPQFTTYYDSMLNIFDIPFNEVVKDFIEVIQNIRELSYIINKSQLEKQRKYLKEISTHNINIIKNDTNLSNKQDLLRLYKELDNLFCIENINTKK